MMIDKIQKAMAEVAKLNDDGIKVQGGKKYTQVVTRVEVFRKHFGYDYAINTDIKPFGTGFLVKATVSTLSGEQIGSGHSYATSIQKEKSIEKLETTAIGRALASCGLSGGEYCTQDEIDTHQERYEPVNTNPQKAWLNKAAEEIKKLQTPEAIQKWVRENPGAGLSEKQVEWYDNLIKSAIERTYQAPMAAK